MPESSVLAEMDPIDVFEPEHPLPSTRKKKAKLGVSFWIAVGWIGLVVFGAIFDPILPLQSPTVPDPCSTYATTMANNNLDATAAQLYSLSQADSPAQAQQMANQGVKPPPELIANCPNPTLNSKIDAFPSTLHWLGTDSTGRDTLARIVSGAQVALLVGVVAVGVGMFFGTLIGLIAGFFRGGIEGTLMTVVDVLLAFPALILAIAIVAFRGQSLFNVCLAIGIVATPGFARLSRGTTLSYSEREFVTAARVMGASNRRIIFRELLPNVALPVLAFYLLAVAIAIVAEGGLAFLGLSVPPPRASWGTMIQSGYNVVNDAPFVVLVPSFIMFITVLAFNFVGDKFRERFDVKESAL